MCGLIGYVGDEPAATIISEALLRLEYRGYDSAGVAIINDGSIYLAKDTGNVAHVLLECNIETLKGKYRDWPYAMGNSRGSDKRKCSSPLR